MTLQYHLVDCEHLHEAGDSVIVTTQMTPFQLAFPISKLDLNIYNYICGHIHFKESKLLKNHNQASKTKGSRVKKMKFLLQFQTKTHWIFSWILQRRFVSTASHSQCWVRTREPLSQYAEWSLLPQYKPTNKSGFVISILTSARRGLEEDRGCT